MSGRIAICGSIIVDSVNTISEWPRQGMLVPIKSVRQAVGGAVCNVGIDLKRLDDSLEVRACGIVGDDEEGAFAIRTMKDTGVDCSRVAIRPGLRTSFTDVMTLESTGGRTFFNLHGADSALLPEDVDVSGLDCDLFHLGYLLLLDGMDAPDEEYGTKAARLLAKVRAAGIPTSLDVVSEQSDRFARIVRPALRHCDYVIFNEIEASAVTGVGADDMRGMCEALLELGVHRQVVIHRPESGASLERGGKFVEVPSLELPDGWIKGTVGAGDAFCAGMLYSILKGMDAESGLRLASCAAAANLAVADATRGALSYAETMNLESRFLRRK